MLLPGTYPRLMNVFEVWVKNALKGEFAKLILEAYGSMASGAPTSFPGFLISTRRASDQPCGTLMPTKGKLVCTVLVWSRYTAEDGWLLLLAQLTTVSRVHRCKAESLSKQSPAGILHTKSGSRF